MSGIIRNYIFRDSDSINEVGSLGVNEWSLFPSTENIALQTAFNAFCTNYGQIILVLPIPQHYN